MTDEQLAEFRAIMHKLYLLDFESDKDCDAVAEIEGELNSWGCRASGSHDWIFDQCGYWQHQYCVHCPTAKYPEMIGKSCRDLRAEMGDITEEEFLSRRS